MRRLEGGRNSEVGVIVCDVDGLKLANDTLGHDNGDALLVATARVIRESVRASDMAARIGGDEFAILLPNSNNRVVEDVTIRIREAIAAYNSENPRSLLEGYSLCLSGDCDVVYFGRHIFKKNDVKVRVWCTN